MKILKINLALFLSLIMLIGFTACNKDDKGETAVITHEGFDFSEGIIPSNYDNSDGETVSWMPNGGTNPNYDGNYVWWRNTNVDADNATIDMGKVELKDVENGNVSWEENPNITPLLVGHVYVAKCKDGYVKFIVNSVSTSGLWECEVEYVFSEDAEF